MEDQLRPQRRFLIFFRYSEINSWSGVECNASGFDSSSMRKKFKSHVSSGSELVNSNKYF